MYFLAFGTDLLPQNKLLVEVIASSLSKMETIFHVSHQYASIADVYETMWSPQKTEAVHINTRHYHIATQIGTQGPQCI